jgi:2,3,4,5-tetrahydropyridine-2-carboxylate N-succinyltransferase
VQNEINKLYEEIQAGKRIDALSTEELRFVFETIEALDAGRMRVCEKQAGGKWITNEWIKKAILLYFRIQKNGSHGFRRNHLLRQNPSKKMV